MFFQNQLDASRSGPRRPLSAGKPGLLHWGIALLVVLIPIFSPPFHLAHASTAYPADQQLASHPMPQLSEPAYRTPTTEPSFGTQIERIADQSAMASTAQYIRHHYSVDQAWNADESLLCLCYGPEALLNGTTYQFIRWVNGPGDFRWSPVDPNAAYGFNEAHQTLVETHPATDPTASQTTLHSFSQFDAGSLGFGPSKGSISTDGQWGVVTGYSTSLGQYGLSVYNFQTNTVTGTYWLGSTSPKWASISPSGKDIVAMWPTVGTGTNQGTWVYDRSFNPLRQLTSDNPHADICTDAQGTEVFVGMTGNGDVSSYALDGSYSGRVLLPYGTVGGGHVSCRNTARPGWCYISDAYVLTDPGAHLVFAVKLDGSQTVEMFSHDWTDSATYDVQAQATPSHDGSRVVWASDWIGGSSAPGYSYVAQESPSTSTATPTATSTPTSTPTSTLAATNTPTAASTATPQLPASSTLGNTAVGPNTDANWEGYVNCSKYQMGATGASATNISTYVKNVGAAPNNQYQEAIYTDSNGTPQTLVAQTGIGTLTGGSSGARNTLPISASLSANAFYWLCFVSNGSAPGTANNLVYGAGSVNQGTYSAGQVALGTLSSSFPGSGQFSNYNYSTYVTLGSSTATPTPTSTLAATSTPTATNTPTKTPVPTSTPTSIPILSAPGAPTNVTAKAQSQSGTVSWTAPSSNGGSSIASYVVRTYYGTGTTLVKQVVVSGTATSTLVSGLANGTTYTFTVQAVNVVGPGPQSTRSNTITPPNK
jgi:Fibronectin type III domain